MSCTRENENATTEASSKTIRLSPTHRDSLRAIQQPVCFALELRAERWPDSREQQMLQERKKGQNSLFLAIFALSPSIAALPPLYVPHSPRSFFLPSSFSAFGTRKKKAKRSIFCSVRSVNRSLARAMAVDEIFPRTGLDLVNSFVVNGRKRSNQVGGPVTT